MSSNSYVAWNSTGLLCGYQGEHPVFTWTYYEFEEHMDECISPSMYHYMASYVKSHISKDDLYEIQGGDYCSGDLEESAVVSYFNLPVSVRTEMHEQELVNLRASKELTEAKETAAVESLLYDNIPFDNTSPIIDEYRAFIRSLIAEKRSRIDRLEREINEEEQWTGDSS
jgi:hypothetical protein